MSEKIKIGLFGFGCVGRGVYENLQLRFGSQVEIKKICIKDPTKERGVENIPFTTNAAELIDDPDIDLIVEVIDNPAESISIISRSFKAGKDVITANKVAVATNLKFLIELQKNTGRTLLYEAAVVAAVPVIRVLETHFSHEEVTGIRGILNGTTNYLLSKIQREKHSFEDALLQAQRAGFAESNPSLDIEGWDAAYKLVILTAHAFGQIHSPEEVQRRTFQEFLSGVSSETANIKCVGSAVRNGFNTRLAVDFEAIDASSDLWPVEYERNSVSITSEIAGVNTLTGNGAGSDPTASAIISDIFQWKKGFSYGYSKYYGQIRQMKDERLKLIYSGV